MFISVNCLDNSISFATASRPVETIPVGRLPKDVVVGYQTKEVFVSNSGDNTISKIDIKTKKIVHSLPVFDEPRGMAMCGKSGNLYVVNKGRSSVAEVSPHDLSIICETPVGRGPRNVKLGDDGMFFATLNEEGAVAVVSKVFNERILTNPNPYGLCRVKDDLYITSIGHNCLSKVNLSSLKWVGTIPTGRHPANIVYNPSSKHLYVTNLDDDTVTVFDLVQYKKLTDISVGKNPYAIALSKDNRFCYVTNNGDDQVSVIDTHILKTIQTIKVGRDPHGIAVFEEES
jgi:YVTN family beta-propeller protein